MSARWLPGEVRIEEAHDFLARCNGVSPEDVYAA
jgi:hypothetical protein